MELTDNRSNLHDFETMFQSKSLDLLVGEGESKVTVRVREQLADGNLNT